MNLYAKLLERKDNPLRVGVIGAGKFGTMYIAQVPRTPGVHLVGIADLSPTNAKENVSRTGRVRCAVARCGAQGEADPPFRRLGSPGQAFGPRHHHRVDRESARKR